MDDLSLGGVEGAVLTQGVAFLYAQAGELLRRRRAARERAVAGVPPTLAELPALELPGTVFERPGGGAAEAAPEVVEHLAGSLREACREVGGYLASEAPGDGEAGLAAADRLRCLLEEVYGTRVTFLREERDGTAPPAARVRAPRAGVVLSGDVRVYGDIAGRDIVNKK
jgi:hypothetical protein